MRTLTERLKYKKAQNKVSDLKNTTAELKKKKKTLKEINNRLDEAEEDQLTQTRQWNSPN